MVMKTGRDSFPKLEPVQKKKKRFDDDTVPDCQESSCSESSDDESAKHAKYQTKEDEDVAVFMQIANQMDMKSLLFLMQCQAREGNMHFQQGVQASANQSAAPTKPTFAAKKPLPKIKKFRFAEVSNKQVRTVVHEIERIEDKSLWWNEQEMYDIRLDAIETVQYFSKFRPQYQNAIICIAQSYMHVPKVSKNKAKNERRQHRQRREIENHLKQLSNDSAARGLEVHIVQPLADLKKTMVEAVIDEQDRCRYLARANPGIDSVQLYEVSAQRIREQALQISAPSVTLAAKMAEFDHMEALKSSLSRWKKFIGK